MFPLTLRWPSCRRKIHEGVIDAEAIVRSRREMGLNSACSSGEEISLSHIKQRGMPGFKVYGREREANRLRPSRLGWMTELMVVSFTILGKYRGKQKQCGRVEVETPCLKCFFKER